LWRVYWVGEHPEETEAHKDVKESQYGYSCIFVGGNFEGGAVVLYELKATVEMAPGNILLFPDALITHRNKEAEGHRISIVTFTEENVYDYWHRKYNMKLKQQEAKERRKTFKQMKQEGIIRRDQCYFIFFVLQYAARERDHQLKIKIMHPNHVNIEPRFLQQPLCLSTHVQQGSCSPMSTLGKSSDSRKHLCLNEKLQT
jgi:hypothetical protein